jgi:hypothetical protein
MKVVTVATHGERYFPLYIESAKRNNIKPIFLGKGETYNNHTFKDIKLRKYLETVNDNEIILFTDAFDCIFLAPLSEIKNKFLSFNCKLVISIDNVGPVKIFNKMAFGGTCQNDFLNTGMIIGYAGYIKSFLDKCYKIRDKKEHSNQKIWTICCQKFNKSMCTDSNIRLFLNWFGWDANKIEIKDGRIRVLNTNTYPCIIQGLGYCRMDKIANELGYNTTVDHINKTQNYNIQFVKYIYRNYKYYKNLRLLFKIVLIMIGIYLLARCEKKCKKIR